MGTDVSITVGSRDNTAADFDALKARLEEIKRKIKDAGGSIDVNTAAGRLQADRLRVALSQLDRKIKPEISVRGADTALLKLGAVDAAMEKLNKKTDNIFVKMSKAGGLAPSGMGIAAGLSPTLIPIAASLAGAVGAIGISFGAAGLGAGAFALLAKSALTKAGTAATAVKTAQTGYNTSLAAARTAYANASAAATTHKQRVAALATEQKAFASASIAQTKAVQTAYAGMSPQQIALSKAVGQFSDAWGRTQKSIVPLISGALRPWLAGVEKGMAFIKPFITPIAADFKVWGQQLNTYFGSKKGSTEIRAIATGLGQFAAIQLNDIVSFFKNMGIGVVHLARDIGASHAMYGAFGGYLSSWGQSFASWSKSQTARADVLRFMAYLHSNGHTLTSIAKDLGHLIPGIAGGLSAGGTLELKALGAFLGLLNRLPPTIAKPLTEIAGAALLLSKTGVLKVGLQVVGKAWDLLKGGTVAVGGDAAAAAIRAALVSGGEAAAAEIRAAMTGGGAAAAGEGAAGEAAAGGAAASGGVRGLFAKLGLGGLTGSVVGGVLVTALVVKPILQSIKNKGTTGVPGQQGNWWETPFNMPGPKSGKSSGNWLTSWAPYEHLLTVDIPNWWNISFNNSIGRIERGFHDIAHGYDNFRHTTSAVYDKIGAAINTAWNTAWNNTIGRLNRGRHDVAHGLDDLRHSTADVFDGARHDIASAWDKTWDNTASRARSGISSVGSQLGNMRHSAASEFDSIRQRIASTWDSAWNNTVSRVRSGAHDVEAGFRGLWNGIWGVVRHWPGQLWQLAKSAVTELWNGAKSVGSGVVGWFKGLGHSILHAIGSVFHFGSPSKTMFKYGQWIVQGMHKGVESKLSGFLGGVKYKIGAGVKQWTPDVHRVLAMLGLPQSLTGRVLYQMQTESSGNPLAINRTDSNAMAGDPSRGLLQTIMTTFQAYRSRLLPDNIYNPMANIFAAVNYAMHVYGRTLMRGGMGMGSGKGYWRGTTSAAPGWAMVGERGPEPVYFRGGERVSPSGGGGGAQPVRLEIASTGQSDFDKFMMNWLYKAVRVKGGGDVQVAFGIGRP